ncbi:hypothetical protein [Haloarcula nitratireducens]|uniref:Small CPxCG-related zinc finger protein n=1 Tax=Haloarcula nitratireducens TaxID=2487749 RepID=A0AAW4PB96_9EURY|nr:hypothetical protein [Halomicroarcula nitratireducens]MBX0295247.1 hypothetical protein [Halomicroarcula nitratireducens]
MDLPDATPGSELRLDADDRRSARDGDRYCRHCQEIALAFDPRANRARCRACGELA